MANTISIREANGITNRNSETAMLVNTNRDGEDAEEATAAEDAVEAAEDPEDEAEAIDRYSSQKTPIYL